MSAIAKVLAGIGHEVSGSDLRGGLALDRLGDFGITTHTGHDPSVAASAELVVASSAVPDADPELIAASEAGVQIWRRPQLLQAVTNRLPSIGATGTHGKTTTTAMLLTALRSTGLDPSFIVGGDISGLNTNGHFGQDDLLVIEADEAFRTFESLNLKGLVVTNIEAEHVEHFGSERALFESFVAVSGRVEGPVLSCADDEGSALLADTVGCLTYGVAPDADWRMTNLAHRNESSRFVLEGSDAAVEVVVNRPGIHNARNAAGALALVASLGYDLDAAAAGLAEFRGVGRRWEHRGTVSGVMMVDDYAHHPTEVAATIAAAEGVVAGRVWAVFQPHLYSRTQRFQSEFGQALSLADVVVVTDVYGSREEPVPGVTGSLVAEAAEALGATVHYVQHKSDLADFLASAVEPDDLVLTMGAGDITLLPTELAKKLASR